MNQSSSVDPAVHLGQDDGEAFRLGPLEIIVKENGSGTRMNLAVAEFRGNTFRIPPHFHTEHDETIHVLEGQMEVSLGERTFTAAAGSCFTIPVNVPHAIWNEKGVRVRFLNVIVGARYLDYFREMAAAATTSLPPPEVIAQVMGRYGLRPVKSSPSSPAQPASDDGSRSTEMRARGSSSAQPDPSGTSS